ncbi:MAG: hypothetical protein A4E42_02382 [Methanoregulaceae archaeon PtaU1.Bin222]|nr:MAG: hypothetical protein A4E42_02382 [Methanoregulaceae archaeon PtaU1.Bin222]
MQHLKIPVKFGPGEVKIDTHLLVVLHVLLSHVHVGTVVDTACRRLSHGLLQRIGHGREDKPGHHDNRFIHQGNLAFKRLVFNELGDCRIALDHRFSLEFPARRNLVCLEGTVFVTVRMAGFLQTEPVFSGYGHEDPFDPPLVNTTDRHLPVLENLGLKRMLAPEHDPLLTRFNELERSSPSLLVLELEDEHQELFRFQIHPEFL